MNIFFNKSINFKKPDGLYQRPIDLRHIEADKKYQDAVNKLKNWDTSGGGSGEQERDSRSAKKNRAPLTEEIKNIINKADNRAEQMVFNKKEPKRNRVENVEVLDINPNKQPYEAFESRAEFNINIALPGEARGVGVNSKEYFKTKKENESVEIEFKEKPDITESVKVFYKIEDQSGEEGRLKKTLSFTFSLKEHMSNESSRLHDLLEAIRNFNSENIKNGTSSHYDPDTGELTVTFSSKRGMKEEFEKLINVDSKENKDLFENLIKEFDKNPGVQNILKSFNNELEDEIFGKEEGEKKKRNGGKFKDYIEEDTMKNIINGIIENMKNNPRYRNKSLDERKAIAVEKIKSIFTQEIEIRKEIFKLQALRHELLKRGTGLDTILEKFLTTNISQNIRKQFNSIIDMLAKAGLKVSSSDLMSGIGDGMEKEAKRSLNPMMSYAHSKLEEVERENKRNFEHEKKNWEAEHQNEKYPKEYKSMLEKLKDSIIEQIDNQIADKAQDLQKILEERKTDIYKNKVKEGLENALGLNTTPMSRNR